MFRTRNAACGTLFPQQNREGNLSAKPCRLKIMLIFPQGCTPVIMPRMETLFRKNQCISTSETLCQGPGSNGEIL